MKHTSWDKCKNCGGEFGIHRWDTNQCPFGGREAPIGQKEQYMTSVFEPETDELAALRAERDELLEALRKIMSCANVRIDDPRIGIFDNARAVLAKYAGKEE